MMREIQILKPFANRTEYKVLKEWFPCKEMELGEIEQGTCVIPAVILSKLTKKECNLLVNWAEQWRNHLLVFPPFYSIDLKERLQLGVELTIARVHDCFYEGLPIRETFISNIKPKLLLTDEQVIALDIFYHTGSGRLTLTTLPLLDYKLLAYEEKCKDIFQKLLVVKDEREEIHDDMEEAKLPELHQHVLLLVAGGITTQQLVCRYLKNIFNISVDEKQIQPVQQQLQSKGYLTKDGLIGQQGQEFIKRYGYRVFVRELSRNASQEGGW